MFVHNILFTSVTRNQKSKKFNISNFYVVIHFCTDQKYTNRALDAALQTLLQKLFHAAYKSSSVIEK